MHMAKRSKGPKFDNMNVRYTVRVNDNDGAKIDKYCEETGRSRSDLFREAVMKQIRGDGRNE